MFVWNRYTYGGSALVFAYKFTSVNRDEFGIVWK